MSTRAWPLVAAPRGRVALVFTDVQGSTRLWERCSAGMREALAVHDQVLRGLLAARGGYEVKTQGDSFMVAFGSAQEAVRWCLEAQQALLGAPWPQAVLSEAEAAEEQSAEGWLYRGLRVRMGVHLGEPECQQNVLTGRADYFGRAVNLAARVADAAHGGQVLLSGAAWAEVAPHVEALGGGLGQPLVRQLGSFRLKGIQEPVALVELVSGALARRRFGSPRVPEVRLGNLPAEAAELVGRTRELEVLQHWLREGTRLLSLLGPAGMGKTRLALGLGALQARAGAWEGGVWLCTLTEASTVEDICHAVARSLGVALTREGEWSDPVLQVGRALDGCGETLVLLDNLEHLIHHVPATLGRWLELAPRTRFLITTREALLLPNERVLELAPLELPAEGESRLEAIARCEAVRLFVQRAQATQGSFQLTPTEAARVADIVRRLDGNALAIELAAARTRVLGVAQIQERLSRRFELLRGGRREASARQATLWGAIDWSWNLLEPAERAALAQCSVFRGGFTLEAAEAVLVLPEGAAEGWGPEVLEAVQSLRAKSLVWARAVEGLAGELRLGLYESIREYAHERLAEWGQAAEVEARHADCYLALARRLRAGGQAGSGAEALRRLTLERENLLAACDNALALQPATPQALSRALAVLVALEPEVAARGPVGLTLARLERALALAETLPVEPLLRAEALAVRGRARLEAGQPQPAGQDLQAAREAFHALGAVAREKRVLVDLSVVARHQGEMAEAWRLVQQAQGLPSGGDQWLEAHAVGNLGLVELLRSGAAAAVPHLRTARDLFRAVGDATYEVGFLTNCALAIGEAGDTAEALALLGEALARASEAGDKAGLALARLNLGCFLLEQARAPEACEHLEAVVHMARLLGMRLLEGTARGELGRALLATGQVHNAQTHLEEAVALLVPVSRWDALRFTAYLATAWARQGDVAAAQAGFSSLEQAPELAQAPALRELVLLLRAAVDLAVAVAASPGSPEQRLARKLARQRLERARRAPAEAASSDLRGSLRLFEQEHLPAAALPPAAEEEDDSSHVLH